MDDWCKRFAMWADGATNQYRPLADVAADFLADHPSCPHSAAYLMDRYSSNSWVSDILSWIKRCAKRRKA